MKNLDISIDVEGKPLNELMNLFNCDIKSNDDFYDVFAYNIIKTDHSYLLAHIDSYNNIRQRVIIFALGYVEEPSQSLVDKLVSYLQCNEALLCVEAIDALIHLEQISLWVKIEPLLNHQSEHVREAVLRYAHVAQQRTIK